MFKKRMLAVVAVVALLASALSGLMMTAQADTDYVWLSDTDGVVVTGDAENGYAWEGNAMVGYSKPFDTNADSVTMKIGGMACKEPAVDGTPWAGLRLTTDYTALGSQNRLESSNGVTVILEQDRADQIRVYTGDTGYVEIYNGYFDWSKTHTFGWTKTNGGIYFQIDGSAYGGRNFADTIPALQEQGNLYLQLTCDANDTSKTVSFSDIKVVEKGWVTDGDFYGSVNGNDTDGYEISESQGTLFYGKPVDLSTVTFSFDPKTISTNSVVSFTNLTANYPGWGQNAGIDLMMTSGQEGDNWWFRSDYMVWFGHPEYGSYCPNAVSKFVVGPNELITLDFRKVDNKWHLFVNGSMAVADGGANFDFSDKINAMGGIENLRINLNGNFNGKSVKVGEKTWSGVAASDAGNGLTKLSFAGESIAAYAKALDLLNDTITFKIPYNESGWTTLQLADTPQQAYGYNVLYDWNQLGGRGGLQLLFDRNDTSTSLNLYAWGPNHADGVTIISDFNWDALHTLRVVKVGEAYFLELDGVRLNKDITFYVASLVNKDAYLRFSSIQVTDVLVGIDVPTAPHFTGAAVTGDEENGYGWSATGGVGYSKPIDLYSEAVEMELTFPEGSNNMAWLAVSSSFMNNNDATPVSFSVMLEKRANDQIAYTYDLNGGFSLLWSDTDHDFTAPHSYGFEKVGNDWFFRVDNTVGGPAVTEKINAILNNGNGNTYLRFTPHDAAIAYTYAGVKIVDKAKMAPTVNLGGQIRSKDAAGNTALRFGFDLTCSGVSYADPDHADNNYTRKLDNAKVTFYGKEYELVDFGAVLTRDANANMTKEGAEADPNMVKWVPANNLYEVYENGTIRYTAVVTNVPENYLNTQIYARTYVTYRDGNNEVTLYGDVFSRSVADCTENDIA